MVLSSEPMVECRHTGGSLSRFRPPAGARSCQEEAPASETGAHKEEHDEEDQG
jgi:hypothetical protein